MSIYRLQTLAFLPPLDDTKALLDAMLGPGEVLRRLCWTMIDLSVLKVIYRFGMAEAISLDHGSSYSDLAAHTGLPEIRLKSLLRQSALNGIFAEDRPDHVVHTPLSRILVRNAALSDWVGHCVEECLPACNSLANTLGKFATSDVPEDSAFALAFGIRESMFSFIEKDQTRQNRMLGAMAGISRAPGHSFDHIVEAYPWNRCKGAILVGVGGSTGFLSVCLARAYPDIGSFVVQDFRETIEEGQAQVPSELADRIQFVAHDIFKAQPVMADAYVLRHICHDWPDQRAAAIIANIVPAMKPTSRILLIELVVLPPESISGLAARYVRNVDMTMLTLLDTQERSGAHWRKVVSQAHPDLSVLSITQPPGSWDSVVENGFEST